MKKIVLSLFVGLFSLVSYTSAYVCTSQTFVGNTITYVNVSDYSYFVVDDVGSMWFRGCAGYSSSTYMTKGMVVDLSSSSQCAFGGPKNNSAKISFCSEELGALKTGLSPGISGLRDVTFEFIPYIVYIGIGILICSIGYVAVKWLVNWLGKKIYSIFNSKRS